MPSVCAPCSLKTSSESVDWTQGSFRCGNRSFCKAITSRSVLPNILGRKICSWNDMSEHTFYRAEIMEGYTTTGWIIQKKYCMSFTNQIICILHKKRNMYFFFLTTILVLD